MIKNIQRQFIGVIAILTSLIYLEWLFRNLNWDTFGISFFFLITSVFGIVPTIIHMLNNKKQVYPKVQNLLKHSPNVAVIIPTWNESITVIQQTLLSLLTQNYPLNRLLIIVSDDARNPEIEALVHYFSHKYNLNIVYHTPPLKNSELRKGDGKAGNLNSAIELIKSEPSIKYIEIRDADDLTGEKDFLKQALTVLDTSPNVAYVQGIKESYVSKNDPFANREKMFYRSLMLSKNAANAVFPCGSGLVWRKDALLDIGGFPTWNLVEDFQSGAEALRRGWKGVYLPIVAAIAQKGPEDIPNVFKQRGTWAMDSLRFLFWGDKSGLNFSQRLHFAESGLFYIYSGIFFLQSLIPAYILYSGTPPIKGNPLEYGVYLSTYLLSVFMYIWSLRNGKSIRSQDLTTSIKMGFGLGPVYLWSLIKVLLYGKNNKPKYVLTRKFNLPSLYLLNVLPQIILVNILLSAIYIHLFQNPSYIDFVSIFWAIFYIDIFFHIIKNSWHGLTVSKIFNSLVEYNQENT